MIYISLLLILIGLLLFAFSMIPVSTTAGETQRPVKPEPVPDYPPEIRKNDEDDGEWPSLEDDVMAINPGSETVKTPKKLYTGSSSPEEEDVELELSFEDDEIPGINDLFLEGNDFSYDDIVSEFEDFTREGNFQEEDVPVVEPVVESVAEPVADVSGEDGGEGDSTAGSEIVNAVLFNDYSSLIDYESRTGTIDPSLDDYRNIKRLGEGGFSVARSGISFLMENKLFRFDFHKLDRLYTGDNFVALGIKGVEAGKLFIFGRPGGMTGRVDAMYREFVEENS